MVAFGGTSAAASNPAHTSPTTVLHSCPPQPQLQQQQQLPRHPDQLPSRLSRRHYLRTPGTAQLVYPTAAVVTPQRQRHYYQDGEGFDI